MTKCSVPIPLSVLKLCSPKHRGIFVVMNRILNRELSPFLFSPRIYVTQMRRPPRTLEKCEGLLTFFFLLEKNCPGIKLKHTFNVKHIVETLIFLVKQPNMFFVFYEKENCVRWIMKFVKRIDISLIFWCVSCRHPFQHITFWLPFTEIQKRSTPHSDSCSHFGSYSHGGFKMVRVRHSTTGFCLFTSSHFFVPLANVSKQVLYLNSTVWRWIMSSVWSVTYSFCSVLFSFFHESAI